MLIVLRAGAATEEIDGVLHAVHELGFMGQVLPGHGRTAVAVLGNPVRLDPTRFASLPGVHKVLHVVDPYRLVSREVQPEPTVVRLPNGVTIGGGSLTVIAGPCAVESEEQIVGVARRIAADGATLLRGGAFKPRSSPYSFQGLGAEGLRMLALARQESGLPVVTEALDPESVNAVAEVADVLQIGARNMQNYPLLRRAARGGKPVLLKRGPAATIEELLLSAEYLLAEGQPDVILCERGVRSFDPATRNLLDLSVIPLVRRLSHLPIIADPSHGTGHSALVAPMALAAVAAGADGLMVEVHPDPASARSDGLQSLTPQAFGTLMQDIRAVGDALGRPMAKLTGVNA